MGESRGPSAEWWQAQTPPERRVIWFVGFAMQQVRQLPPYACDDSTRVDSVAWSACREAFYLNVRLVAEFFVKMPERDYTARSFLPSWEPPGDLAARIQRAWGIASKHVMHMSRDRVPADVEDVEPEDTSEAGLSALAQDCQSIAVAFVEAYTAATHNYGEDFVNLITNHESEQ